MIGRPGFSIVMTCARGGAIGSVAAQAVSAIAAAQESRRGRIPMLRSPKDHGVTEAVHMRDQPQRCRVSAARTDAPQTDRHAAEGLRQAAAESFAQKSVIGMAELMVVLGIV